MLIALIAECARDKASLGSDYHWASWEDFSSQGLAANKVEFCAAPLISRGKRKGKPNFSKSTDTKVVWVTDAELKAWVPVYVERTGNCSECMGKGQEMESWDHIEGYKWKPCPVCQGTGRSNGAEPAASKTTDSENTHESLRTEIGGA